MLDLRISKSMQIIVGRSDIHRLAQIVREETGNQVQDKNFMMLESRIKVHLGKLGFKTMSEYWNYFEKNEMEERRILQSLMTTHYTFFFREYGHFEMLEKWIEEEAERLQRKFTQSGTPVRVWSAASSRGQEVYSLAMFLDHHLAKRHKISFEIIGTDIDVNSIAYAKNGVYPIVEVNTIPSLFLNGNWKRGTGQVKDFAAVHNLLKERIQFETLNLLEIEKWSNRTLFDVIFCRNVLIYFSDENVRKIAMNLASRLDNCGLLVTGMSEPLRFEGWPLKPLGSSCYRREIKTANFPAPTKIDGESAKSGVDLQIERKKYCVLCVDDSPTIQKLVQKIFTGNEDFEIVEVAGNGREAREKLDRKKFDLITLDIHMPEVSGIEFLEKLYNRLEDPPVLMLSSVNRTDIDLASKALSLGAFDYVEKPAMNNLQKSGDEILAKAKMAIRAKEDGMESDLRSFDQSIAQQIVIPDASQCLRLVVGSSATFLQLEQVIYGQEKEYRSPPVVVFWGSQEGRSQLESKLLIWTKRKVIPLKEEHQLLRPNCVYVIDWEHHAQILGDLKVKSISLQILSLEPLNYSWLKSILNCQVLVDEPLSGSQTDIERLTGVPVSDVCPATSFSSLSAEYFSGLRKAVA